MLDYWLWGLKPAGYHVANILYHGIAGFILFLVLLELRGTGWQRIAGAVLFISHPVLTDSVTYISGRRDVLVGLFYLLSFYCFVRYRKEPRWGNAVLTGIFFLLALGSKEMGITLPAVCLAYDFTQSFTAKGSRAGFGAGMRQAVGEVIRKNWKLYLPLAVLAGIFFYSKIFLYYPSLKSSYYGGSAISNFATVVRIICYYIKLVLFPVVLHADYSYNAFALSQSFLEWRVLGAGLVVVGLLGVTLWSLARQGLVFFGGMWFFITLVPVSQIFPHHELMAEHYLYVPLAGVMIMVLPLLAYVLEKKQKAALGLIILIAVLFGLRTIERNRDWRDGMTLWSGVVAAAPESARGHDNLGTSISGARITRPRLNTVRKQCGSGRAWRFSIITWAWSMARSGILKTRKRNLWQLLSSIPGLPRPITILAKFTISREIMKKLPNTSLTAESLSRAYWMIWGPWQQWYIFARQKYSWHWMKSNLQPMLLLLDTDR